MQADLRHTGFFTKKIKAFSTDRKGPRKVVFSGAMLHKSFPFMFASAFMFTACSRSSQQQTEETYKQICAEVVDDYNLQNLTDVEPFSITEIDSLMQDSIVPPLEDTNYNHCPENAANFWEIVKNGIATTKEVQNSDNLTAEQKKEYRTTMVKMLSRLRRYKGTKDSIDLTDYHNLQLFLYAEKVVKFKDYYTAVIKLDKGFLDERHDFFGRYYKDFDNLAQQAEKYPYIETFAKTFYLNQDRLLLKNEDMRMATLISKRNFDLWRLQNGIKDDNLWTTKLPKEHDTSDMNDELSSKIKYWFLRDVQFGAVIKIDVAMSKDVPIYVIIEHELRHIFQIKPASNEKPEDNKLSSKESRKLPNSRYNQGFLAELGPSLHSLMQEDQIYKEIHGIKPETVVDYGVDIDTGARKIQIGELAAWVYRMEKKYESPSIDEILAKPEALEYLNYLGGGKEVSNQCNMTEVSIYR